MFSLCLRIELWNLANGHIKLLQPHLKASAINVLGLIDTNPCDAGPGSTVPEEQLSHGRDSSNMSGHAIPAMLCGNQYAVLFTA